MTRPTRRRVLYQSKTSSIVTSWSSHHCATSHHVMTRNAPQSLLDRSFVVAGYLSGKVSRSFHHVIFFYYALSSSFSSYVICPYPYSSSDRFLSHDNVFPLFLLIHSFSWPTSFPNNLTNRSHPPSCLCFLLLFYLWFACLWSSVTATVLVLKLY